MATRQFRELDTRDPTIGQKISQSMKGRAKTEQHKQHLPQSMKNYWATIPSQSSQKNAEDNNKDITNDKSEKSI